MSNGFALKLIRDYHKMLLSYANQDTKTKKMLSESKFMPFLWKYQVAESLTNSKKAMEKVAKNIKEVRDTFNCRGF